MKIAFGTLSFLFFTVSAWAQSSSLVILNHGQKQSYTTTELLRSPHLQHFKVENDPTYSTSNLTYDAIPLADLIPTEAQSEGSALTFTCRDGFSASIESKLLFHSAATPWVAVESAAHPWPKIASRNMESAGPFYLIWKDAKKSDVGREQWPFQITKFEVRPSSEERFAKTNPTKFLEGRSDASAIRDGYKLFNQNCFVCHQLNGEGDSQMGPDLNLPLNPTEYLTVPAIRQQIRDPQKLRHWPQAKMTGFSKASLSDVQVDLIIEYLSFMKGHKL